MEEAKSPLKSPLLPQYDSITPTTPLNIPPKKNEEVGSNVHYAEDAHAHTRDSLADVSAADHTPISFDYWWNLYSHGQFLDERKKCERKWEEYSEPIKKKIIEHSTWFVIDNFQKPSSRQKHPWWYLYDETWQGERPMQKIEKLNSTEADIAKKEGKEVWQCKLPDGTFGFLLLEDAEKMKLEKMWKL